MSKGSETKAKRSDVSLSSRRAVRVTGFDLDGGNYYFSHLLGFVAGGSWRVGG